MAEASAAGKGLVPRLVLLGVLVVAVVLFFVENGAKSQAQAAYDKLPTPDEADWTKEQVREAIGQAPDEESARGPQVVEVYRFSGLFNDYPLAVRYEIDPDLQAARMVEKTVFRDHFDE